MQRFARIPAALAVLAAATFATAPTWANGIVSFRAEYKYFIGEGDADAGGGVQENRVNCTAWVQSSRVRMQGANLLPSRQQLETRETLDGRGMTFTHSVSFAGRPAVTTEAAAMRGEGGKPALVRFTSPKARSLRLPRGTMFPAAFYLRTLRELQRARDAAVPRTPVFGMAWRGRDVIYVEARRLRSSEPLFNRVEGDSHLLDAPAIDIELRYYAGPTAKKPLYRVVYKLHANGIYSRAVYYHPVATFTVELTSVHELEKAAC